MKSKRFLTLGLAILLMFISTGCSSSPQQKENYILEDHSGFIYNGEKYIPIDLDALKIDVSRTALSNTTRVGRISEQGWRHYDCGSNLLKFNLEIPLFSADGCLDAEFFCPESRYDECMEYLQCLSWTNTLGYPIYSPKMDFIYSDELTTALWEKIKNEPSGITEIPHPARARLLASVYQYDSTRLFRKEVGTVIFMPNGDVYVFPGSFALGEYNESSPSPEEYTQVFPWTETYKIPADLAEELWEPSNMENG